MRVPFVVALAWALAVPNLESQVARPGPAA
jgi:hypothetical protein